MKENIAIKVHRAAVMGRRVRQLSKILSGMIPLEAKTVLDVGAGTGEIAVAINEHNQELSIHGVDVSVRSKTFIPVKEYDGVSLPYEDESFDIVMIVDVLHHTEIPSSLLLECKRVSRKWLLVKDHVNNSFIDEGLLRFMDWAGNRAHNVDLTYNYLSSLQWDEMFGDVGLKKVKTVIDLQMYPKLFDSVFGRGLHCVHLLSKC